MKYLGVCTVLLLALAAPARAQIVVDCSNCSQAEWGAEYNPATGGCASNPRMGCGPGCNCWLSFWAGYGLSAKPDFFGGAFVRDEKGIIQGFRIDRPGPLAALRVKPGDVATLINGRRPRRSHLGTEKRPVRSAEATWGSDGTLRLRFHY